MLSQISNFEEAKPTTSTPGFPGGNFGRDGGLGGGGGGVGLLQDANGVAGRAGDDEPEINAHYKYGVELSLLQFLPTFIKNPNTEQTIKQTVAQTVFDLGWQLLHNKTIHMCRWEFDKIRKLLSHNKNRKAYFPAIMPMEVSHALGNGNIVTTVNTLLLHKLL